MSISQVIQTIHISTPLQHQIETKKEGGGEEEAEDDNTTREEAVTGESNSAEWGESGGRTENRHTAGAVPAAG